MNRAYLLRNPKFCCTMMYRQDSSLGMFPNSKFMRGPTFRSSGRIGLVANDQRVGLPYSLAFKRSLTRRRRRRRATLQVEAGVQCVFLLFSTTSTSSASRPRPASAGTPPRAGEPSCRQQPAHRYLVLSAHVVVVLKLVSGVALPVTRCLSGRVCCPHSAVLRAG